MFTGIIQQIGTLRRRQRTGGDERLLIEAGASFLDGVEIGDSIATSGPCLTVTGIEGASFSVDVSIETLQRTTLGALRPGARLNLEKSLTPSAPLGGHFVTGHIDGVGRLISSRPEGRSRRMRFEIPAGHEPLVAPKGSIAIDGVSLTVNGIEGRLADVNLVPHTLEQTTLGGLKPGDAVNIEVDLLARYLARLMTDSGYNR